MVSGFVVFLRELPHRRISFSRFPDVRAVGSASLNEAGLFGHAAQIEGLSSEVQECAFPQKIHAVAQMFRRALLGKNGRMGRNISGPACLLLRISLIVLGLLSANTIPCAHAPIHGIFIGCGLVYYPKHIEESAWT